MAEKVWFITGASRGLGRIWAEAALSRGDKVAVTARDQRSLDGLRGRFGDAALPLSLDVTHPDQAFEAIERTYTHFGRLDVVLNNAGYTLVGTVEEASEAEVRALFDTNYFGTLRVIKAALPRLRAQGHGHIIGVSSGLGIVAVPLLGYYSTTKWAIEALHDSLAQEVRSFGIRVSLIEPGAYATEFAADGSLKASPSMDAYVELRRKVHERLSTQDRGEPAATAGAVLDLVDAHEPPLRMALGSAVLPMARAAYAERIATWEAWASVSNAAQGEPTSGGVSSF